MFKKVFVRMRPTYAGVTATLALFVALGGGAYAAATLPARSVGPAQLKKNAVVRAKIKKNAVNGSKVADGSLRGTDINESSLGTVPSATRSDSSTHSNSSAALDRLTYKTAAGTAPPGGGAGAGATATCDPGQHVVGGGVRVDDPANANILDSYPDAGNTAWTGRAWAVPNAVNFTVFAVCATATTIG